MDRRNIVVILSEDTVKGKEGEPDEVKERQERIRKKRREEQWESTRGRELIAEDRKRAAELGNNWRRRRVCIQVSSRRPALGDMRLM